MKNYISEDLFLLQDERGKIVCTDLAGADVPILADYGEIPFEIDFDLYDKGECIHGNEDNFILQKEETREKEIWMTFRHFEREISVIVVRYIDKGVIEQRCRAENHTGGELCLKKLHNKFGGIACECIYGEFEYLKRIEIGIVRGEWCGEGQFCWVNVKQLGLFRAAGHNTRCTGDISSVAAYTTRKYAPSVFFRDKISGKTWAVQHLPDGPYCLSIGLADKERTPGSIYNISCGAGTSDKHGFRIYLEEGKQYECSKTLLTCAENFGEAVKKLTFFRRERLKKFSRAPIMFNDYMNCLWTHLDEKNCLALIEVAAQAGAEGYCFDDGWYRGKDEHGLTGLGDWIPCDGRFGGHTFRGMINEICNRGLIAGVWTELEVCSAQSQAVLLPDDFFLKNEGRRIYRCGRYYFDLRKEEVRQYLIEKVRALYDIGIRYIKNDYNGHPGCGIDSKQMSSYAGLEDHCRAVGMFYASLRECFPDLYLENCASGAMRADSNIMQNFNTQSVSDCEEYVKMPSILSGMQLSLLPEQISVWVYPYPQLFWDMGDDSYFTEEYVASMGDGEQTIYNFISGMMGNILLSGRIDRADAKNFTLISEGVKLCKKWRLFVDRSYPVFPLGFAELTEPASFMSHGLRCGNKMLLAVWRRDTEEDSVNIPLQGIVSAKEIFPCRNFKYLLGKDCLTVFFERKNQAVLFETDFS